MLVLIKKYCDRIPVEVESKEEVQGLVSRFGDGNVLDVETKQPVSLPEPE